MDFPIWVLFFFSILIGDVLPATAQNDFWGKYCGLTGNYTKGSPYQQDLDDVLYSFTGTNNGFGFYDSTSGQANAAALCRGDIGPDACRRCVDDATRQLRKVCPNQLEAIGWYDLCFLRYSNREIEKEIDVSVSGRRRDNVSDSSYDQWNQTVANLLGRLRREVASGDQLRKYASGNITAPGLSTIYGFMQCTPGLSSTECDGCLVGIIRDIRRFDRSLGLGFHRLSCSIRYETYSFFNSTWYPAPPPSGERYDAPPPSGEWLPAPPSSGKCGYMAPEYAMEGLFSTKSDVYGFGVLLLEIVSGQRNNQFRYEDQPESLLSTAYKLWKDNEGEQLIDDRLTLNVPIGEALRWINIALLCVQEDPQDRPTMSTVVFMLEGDQWSANLPMPSEPQLSFARFVAEFEQTTTSGDSNTRPLMDRSRSLTSSC
ncbi:hypothetical protein L6452_35355 [Arctium lappa]|uniref:Uncharacterized protein n=1 Tax=Arctium lappa TaxID=4217 RepID=A0ACB8Y6Q9_ARCLA|nr:hypothetical protein L6452_35355 [Arctium lappa]